MRRRALWLAALAGFIALLAVVFLFNPMEGGFPYPRCAFKMLTGWDCPGCGSTRALHALLHGRIAEAWADNPAVFVVLPLAALCLAAESPRFPRLRRVIFSSGFVIIFIIAAIGWTIFRNLA
ncbi:MAG: DUF2752 domain-containing protein [Bacteroides sp.]|nr:DUF2752 domain-containing protein [Bacteroides sp.]MCM1379140.1 DUF2752 domain-containing protein [Bacteroides sp.]MCM1445334.1 DUF2752 domain-containing protein [Prevotella sp.]